MVHVSSLVLYVLDQTSATFLFISFTYMDRKIMLCHLLHMQTSYILAVNSGILSDTGGTCSDADCTVSPSWLGQ